ncbi:S-adenosyl-L-methionine-dependent tRNA 4-demethylwyosine synthase TYW1-like [Amphiura filiformis]|uniref:S-adenosyl-L-methionine-dependent tRNA 4-demethylwyosine synthase TYW1-like n=1 Tax=Amphiura filiformis TaxID=82378 RepID=UPI003B214BF7
MVLTWGLEMLSSILQYLPCWHSMILIAVTFTFMFILARINNRQEKQSTAKKDRQEGTKQSSKADLHLHIWYGTQTGTAKQFAEILSEDAQTHRIAAEIHDLKDFDPENHILTEANTNNILVFIVSTYIEGQPPENARWFHQWLQESVDDFRVPKTLLKGVRFTVFGLGNSLYHEHYNEVSRNIEDWLSALSATSILPRGEGNENVADSKNGGLEADFDAWKTSLLQDTLSDTGMCRCGEERCTDKVSCKCEQQPSDHQNAEESSSEDESPEGDDAGGGDGVMQTDGVMDLEDLGKVMHKMKAAKQRRDEEENSAKTNNINSSGDRENNVTEPREMITPLLRQSLTKQGYKLVGSHSGVKLCRWTKSMLRGRGGCYKHTFYGIESHRCMETTPSLACANKCVFCWRHHTNPVGTEWRWKMDDAETILAGALENHYKMVKQFKGVPGVQPERLAEAKKAQHCALSLVGEPIMYPEINKLVRLLHQQEISTFLVTNAQFPDAIRTLVPVTQLYVSVDASTKESLKKIDRPLFRDFWPRFLDSLKALSDKGQRTVYRLTIVKSWNSDEIEAYAKLVDLGKPDLIEIKGVTYCGESKASTLTMANVPWHEEVVSFVQKLVDLLPDYEIASEHEHSNCILAANKKFKVNNEWHTWIDYPQFHALMKAYESSEGKKTFTAVDYMAKTPDWAVFGSQEQGFDPAETRFRRKGKNKDITGC